MKAVAYEGNLNEQLRHIYQKNSVALRHTKSAIRRCGLCMTVREPTPLMARGFSAPESSTTAENHAGKKWTVRMLTIYGVMTVEEHPGP